MSLLPLEVVLDLSLRIGCVNTPSFSFHERRGTSFSSRCYLETSPLDPHSLEDVPTMMWHLDAIRCRAQQLLIHRPYGFDPPVIKFLGHGKR